MSVVTEITDELGNMTGNSAYQVGYSLDNGITSNEVLANNLHAREYLLTSYKGGQL